VVADATGFRALAEETQHVEKSNNERDGSHQEEKANPPLVGFGAGDRSRRAFRFTGLGHRKIFLSGTVRVPNLYPATPPELDLDQRATIDRCLCAPLHSPSGRQRQS